MEKSEIIVQLRAHTRLATCVAWMLYPLVCVGLLTEETVVALAMKFVRVRADIVR